MLLDKPIPDRAAAAAADSACLCEMGLVRCLLKSFYAVPSKSAIMLHPVSQDNDEISVMLTYASAFAGQSPQNVQNVDRVLSLTAGLASTKPFLMHFSIKSTPPVCSR